MSIEIRNVSKSVGSFRAVRDVSLQVESGELLALLGPSGSGKTTLLRVVAGLEFPDRGSIHIHGEDHTHRSVQERAVGFVFQHYALFRHMTVFDNISFGLRVKPRAMRPDAGEIRDRVTRLLQLVQLDGMAGRFPHQLSGGQRQRVALARALAVEPRILLLDEPFGALDAKVRADLRRWLRQLHDDLGFTSIFVTHDQEEALELADRVVIMDQGQVQQVAPPTELFDRPANPFVLDFLGEANLFEGEVRAGVVSLAGVRIPAEGFGDGARVTGGIRSFDLKFWAAQDGVATVERVFALGDKVRVDARLDDGRPIFAQFPRRSSLLKDVAPGARIQVEVTRAHLYAVTSR